MSFLDRSRRLPHLHDLTILCLISCVLELIEVNHFSTCHRKSWRAVARHFFSVADGFLRTERVPPIPFRPSATDQLMQENNRKNYHFARLPDILIVLASTCLRKLSVPTTTTMGSISNQHSSFSTPPEVYACNGLLFDFDGLCSRSLGAL